MNKIQAHRDPVENHADKHCAVETSVGQVLIEQEKVVAVVQKQLFGVVVGQGAAAHVIDNRLRDNGNAVTHVFQPPADVNLLHMGEEIVVEASRFGVEFAADEKARARGPENIAYVVVLAVVSLNGAENAAAAERIAVFVDESARCSGILKISPLVVGEKFGGAGRHIGVGIHIFGKRIEPALGNLDVGVQKHKVFSLNLFERFVVAARKAVVLVELQHFDSGELLAYQFNAVVG